MALNVGGAFYIMTSARDILLDVFAPALNKGKFTTGLFVLCRYSLRPFAVGLLVSGIRARLFPFASGDCPDYRTWLEADRGIKRERTNLSERTQGALRALLGNAAEVLAPGAHSAKRGNVLYPEG